MSYVFVGGVTHLISTLRAFYSYWKSRLFPLLLSHYEWGLLSYFSYFYLPQDTFRKSAMGLSIS